MLVLFSSRSYVSFGVLHQDRFRKLVESDESLNKWCSVPEVVHELVSKEVRCDKKIRRTWSRSFFFGDADRLCHGLLVFWSIRGSIFCVSSVLMMS